MNVLRGIATGWIFQLNGDATFSFCKSAINVIGFGVNSLGKHTNPLCWSIIQHQSESEITYTCTFLELQEAAMLLFDVHTCDDPDCHFCVHLVALMQNPEVVKYTKSDKFKAGKIPVDSAQCDNHMGFGNFTREVFDFDPNICKCHALGKCLFLPCITVADRISYFYRHSGGQLLARQPISQPQPRKL